MTGVTIAKAKNLAWATTARTAGIAGTTGMMETGGNKRAAGINRRLLN